MPDGYDYLFKLLLIGDSGVGKVCGLLRASCQRIACRQTFADPRLISFSFAVMSTSAVRRGRVHGQLPEHDRCGFQNQNY